MFSPLLGGFLGFLAAFVYLYVGWGREKFGREAYGAPVLGLVQSCGTAELLQGMMSLDASGC